MAVTSGSTSVPGQVVTLRHSPDVVRQGIYEQSTTISAPLGARLELTDGRVYRYARAGGVTLNPCQLMQGPVPSANYLNKQVTVAGVVGGNTLAATMGAAVTANQFADGYLHINNGGGGYTLYKVKSHLAGTSNVVFNLYDPIQTAISTSMYITLTNHQYDGVVVCPTTLTQAVAGVPPIGVTTPNYFWLQTWGPCSLLLGAGPPAIGDTLMRSGATGGAVIVYAVGTSVEPIGWLMRANVAADYGIVFLTISP